MWVPSHNGVVHSQVAGGGNGHIIRRVDASILDKQSLTAEKGWSSLLGGGRGGA